MKVKVERCYDILGLNACQYALLLSAVKYYISSMKDSPNVDAYEAAREIEAVLEKGRKCG